MYGYVDGRTNAIIAGFTTADAALDHGRASGLVRFSVRPVTTVRVSQRRVTAPAEGSMAAFLAEGQ